VLKHLGIVIVCLSLVGCNGFKLRGSFVVPKYLSTLYISPCEPYEPLQSVLRARLKRNNVKVVNYADANVTVLEVSRPTTKQQVLAYGSSGEVQRYNLTLTVTYTLIIKGDNPQRTSRTITRSRELNRSNNMLLSNEGEEQIVKRELLSEAVSEILRQITRPQHNDDNPC
jgi:outer membrane lipopolysaccharide assembly protein LptE/RlpB